MSVHTDYDSKRDYLRDKLNDCLRLAKELLDDTVWGYDDMRDDYEIEVYQAVKKARDSV